jgi:hypothetical protein
VPLAHARRLTQRWEASLWLAGKQMYLGGFVAEEDAARAYDLAALACKGLAVPTNFAAAQYKESLAEVSGSSRVRAQPPPARQRHSRIRLCCRPPVRQAE